MVHFGCIRRHVLKQSYCLLLDNNISQEFLEKLNSLFVVSQRLSVSTPSVCRYVLFGGIKRVRNALLPMTNMYFYAEFLVYMLGQVLGRVYTAVSPTCTAE